MESEGDLDLSDGHAHVYDVSGVNREITVEKHALPSRTLLNGPRVLGTKAVL